MPPKVSVLILTYNSKKVLPACLQSLVEQTTPFEFEVLVVDNESADGTVEWVEQTYPQFKVLSTGANLGFAKGNNFGIARVTGEYVLILNPDTILNHRTLVDWVSFADERPDAGAFGCRVLNPDGTIQYASRPFPKPLRFFLAAIGLARLPVVTVEKIPFWNPNEERNVDWVAGCCLLVRGLLLKQLGGFDERFFYFYEDIDLCHRIWSTGSPIVYTPLPVITHLGGNSIGRTSTALEIEKCLNRYRYFKKYFGDRGVRQCRISSLIYFAVRISIFGAVNLFRRDAFLRKK